MSRIGKSPIPVPSGVDVTIAGRARHREGPQGHPRARHPRRHHRPPGRRRAPRRAPRRRAPEPGPARPGPLARQQHGRRRHRGFTKELEIVGVGYRATAQGPSKLELALGFSHPVDGRRPRRHHLRGARPDPHRRARASTRSWSARWPPTSASIRKPEPYKGKGVRYAGEHVAAQGREGRASRNDEQSAHSRSETPASAATAGCARRCGAPPSGPRLAVFRSNKHISAQVIDDRAGRTLAAASTIEADLRGAGGTGNKDAATKVGELVAERAKAAGVDQGRLRPRRLPLPRPRRGARRRRPRSRTGVLMANGPASTHRARDPRQSTTLAARVAGHQHQPRRQGRQGRPSVLASPPSW